MKNTKIVRAWDSVNPTPAQKRRMRAALEAQLSPASQVSGAARKKTKGEEPDITTMDFSLSQSGQNTKKTGKTKKPRPKYQTSQPKKHKGNALVMIAAMLAVVVAGGLFLGVMKGNLEGNPNYARPIEDLPPPTTEATQPTETAQLPEAYQERIDTYITAIREGWNLAQCSDGGISLATPYVEKLDDLGYALMDLDGDGTEELLITDGSKIYSLYGLGPDGEAVQWITGMERISYYLCADNMIAEIGSNGAAGTNYTFYCFMGTTLDKILAVTYDAYQDQETPWFLGDAMEPITEEKASEVIASYPHRYISHVPLSGSGNVPEGAVPEETVLSLYAQEISGVLAEYTKTENMTFCFYDYDGDGESECLLGAGEAVYAVLRPEALSGGVTSIQTSLMSGSENAAYLCENGIVEDTGYGQGYLYYAFYKVQGNEKLDHVLYDYQSWYTKADGEDLVPVSEEEANAVLGKYKRLNLPWKDISQFPVEIPEAAERTGMELFEDVFVPIATSGKKVTEDELKAKIEEKGYQWIISEGQIYCYASDTSKAWISANLASENGGLGDELIFLLPGEVDRWVSVNWVGDSVRYLTGTDGVLDGVDAGTVEELRIFLNADDDAIALRKTTESFARAYFARDVEGMREQTASDVTIREGKMYYEAVDLLLFGIGIVKDAQEQYDRAGYVQASAAAYLNETDSYDFLTMEIVKENGQWKVSSWYLQK